MNGDDEQRATPLPGFGAGARVGDQLRAAREDRDLALSEIAQRTRIPMRHLQMIEDGAYDGLPAATYSAGFVKSYARQVGLDGQRLSEQFRAEMGRSSAPQNGRALPYEPADPRRTPPAGLGLLALVVALVAGLGYLYWRGSHDQPVALAARGPDGAVGAPAASAPPIASPATVPAASAGGPVTIGASQDVWIKVSDGPRTLFMGLMKPGNRFQLPADAVEPTLTTGRPGVTTVSVGATPIPTLGDPDRAARNVSLKPAALLARVAAPPPAVQPPPGTPTAVQNGAGPA